MSGHSKWAGIKHQKAVVDARRGQAFTKLANEISLAARAGADPETNFKLRLAIAKAKAQNMPTANIERAVKRGSGQLAGTKIEEIMYEGYGPGGAAIMIEVATDNRNRAAADVRSTLSKNGGRLVESGSVSYQFDQRGVIIIKSDDLEAAGLAAIEAGAEDVEEETDQLMVYTKPNKLEQVRSRLADQKLDITSAELTFVPQTTITISDLKTAQTLIKLMNFLEGLDDVTGTYANFDIPGQIMEQVS